MNKEQKKEQPIIEQPVTTGMDPRFLYLYIPSLIEILTPDECEELGD